MIRENEIVISVIRDQWSSIFSVREPRRRTPSCTTLFIARSLAAHLLQLHLDDKHL